MAIQYGIHHRAGVAARLQPLDMSTVSYQIPGIIIYSGTMPANVNTAPSAPATHAPLVYFQASTTASYSTFTLSGVAISGTAGQFTYTSQSPTTPALAVGMVLNVTGTYGGTGSISGYVTNVSYVVSAATGSTFTLVTQGGAALVTTAGTPTGLTYTAYAPLNTFNAISSVTALNTGTAAWFRVVGLPGNGGLVGGLPKPPFDFNGATVTASTGGVLTFSSSGTTAFPDLSPGMLIYVTGTAGGTGSITGYTSGTVYYVSSVTQASTSTTATLQTASGGAVTSSAGTITGLNWNVGLPLLQGTVGTSGTDMIVTNTSITAGQTCNFTSMTITAFGA